MIIRRNTSALRTYNAGRKTVSALSKNLEKLSSGYRINRAADDAAGLCASEKMRAKITELGRCQHNASEGIDLARTADAALQEVNDMLKRARSLCIQAENGTYSDQELAAISDEMNHLFGEIDRISAGSYHNSICLFRNEVEPDFHYEYDEEFTPVGDDLQLWGEMDFIVGKQFDEAADAIPATAVFELDDAIDPDDPSTLEGTALTVAGRTFYFTKGTSLPPELSSSYYTYRVAIGGTVEQTLQNMVRDYPSYLSSISIENRTVTLTAPLRDLSYTLYGIQDTAKDGNAEWANGTIVQSPAGKESLDPVDAAANNAVYSSPVEMEYSFGSGKTGTISADDLNNLKHNTLKLYRNSYSYSPDLSLKLDTVLTSSVTTWEQFGSALANKIDSLSNYSANYSGGKLTVTYNTTTTSSQTTLHIDIETGITKPAVPETGGTPAKPGEKVKTWNSTGVSFTVQQTQAEGAEAREICTVEVPSLSGKFPCSFNFNGSTYLYYNKNDPAYKTYVDQGLSIKTTASLERNVTSVTAENVAAELESRVRNALGGASNVTVNRVGNKLEIVAQRRNLNLASTLNRMFSATQCEIYAWKEGTPAIPGTGGSPAEYSKRIIPDGTSKTQSRTITFDLGPDVKALEGKGFSISPYSSSSSYYATKIEFINSDNGGSLRDDYIDIDLKTCNTYEDVRAAVSSKLGTGYSVILDSNKLKISRTGSLYATDGILGIKQLSKSGQVRFADGVNTGYSQTGIDFSSINENNLDTLLGKGFRINCATCSGEYINVFFCWTNDGSVPPAFEREDPVTGIIRTIHNIPVELSKISSGDKIVEDIVRQVKPSLKHYTDVAVGNPPTTLLAMEKRPGDYIYDNRLWLGSIETGVEANFTYSVSMAKVIDPPPPRTLKESEVNIYVGSDPEPQIIPIHLPYIDLKQLRLRPPELVDLTATDQDAADWLQRVDDADIAISSARGTIGADYNRLEHAFQDLSNADINLTDSESRIRDADMAELMKEQTKLQILMQSQQSMLAQANQVPQGVLELLQ